MVSARSLVPRPGVGMIAKTMKMIATTTSNSISVKANRVVVRLVVFMQTNLGCSLRSRQILVLSFLSQCGTDRRTFGI